MCVVKRLALAYAASIPKSMGDYMPYCEDPLLKLIEGNSSSQLCCKLLCWSPQAGVAFTFGSKSKQKI